MTHLHILVPAITRGTLARTHELKKGEGEKVESKSQDCCVTFKPKNYLEVLLSAHSPTSQANILHLDHKAAKCMPFKWLYE